MLKYKFKQFFEADAGDNKGGGTGEQKTTEAKYTDDQANDLIKKEKVKLLKRLGFDDEKAASEAIEKMREAEKSKMTEEEKRKKETEEVERLRKEHAEAKEKLSAYEKAEAVRAAKVPLQFVDFVAFQVGKLVTEDNTFDKALTAYLKDNPQYGGTAKPNGNTGMPHGSGTTLSDDEAYLQKKYAKNKYLK